MNDGRGRKVAIVGGDDRMVFAGERLAERGFECALFGNDCPLDAESPLTRAASPENALQSAIAVLAPIPITRDGIHLNAAEKIRVADFLRLLSKEQILVAGCVDRIPDFGRLCPCAFVDYNEIDEYALPNSLATAEITIALAALRQAKMLADCSVAVFGFGRIGRELARLLTPFGSEVTVFARSEDARRRAAASGWRALSFDCPSEPFADILVNTVPAEVGCPPESVLKRGGLLIELAGQRYSKSAGYTLLPAPSLPGSYCPRSMGERLAELTVRLLSPGKQ